MAKKITLNMITQRSVEEGVGIVKGKMTPDYFEACSIIEMHDDAAQVDRPQNLERRTKGMARLGGLIPASQLAKARVGEAQMAAQINGIFDSFDVVLTPGPAGPPFRVGELQGRGALWSLMAAALRVPFYGVFNATGQPAASVPAGYDAAGLPLSVQLVGRPDDEATLLAVGAQLEELRRWADRRPPIG